MLGLSVVLEALQNNLLIYFTKQIKSMIPRKNVDAAPIILKSNIKNAHNGINTKEFD